MSKPKMKGTKGARDVLQETIEFLMTRKGLGATVPMTAAGLGLSTPGARYRLDKLAKQGRVINTDGFYRAATGALRQLPPGSIALEGLLTELKTQREKIERQITAVEDVIELIKARRNGG